MRQTIDNADIRELVLHEGGAVLYDGAEGVIAAQPNGTVLSDITDGDALCARLDALGLHEPEQFAVKSKSAADALKKHYGLEGEMPCTQWVYCKAQPPVWDASDIRPLTPELAPVAAAHYHLVDNSTEYIRKCIDGGRMWGLFEEGRLAGFIGLHNEGSMGMLEVFPEYRRKGYGQRLEAFLIDWHLRQGRQPYCHVVDGNEASVRLQTKLGLTKADLPAIWVY